MADILKLRGGGGGTGGGNSYKGGEGPYVGDGTWFQTEPENDWTTAGRYIGKYLPFVTGAMSTAYDLWNLEQIKNEKLKHRSTPYNEISTYKRAPQKYPADIRRSHLQDIASVTQPSYKGSDAQLQLVDRQTAGEKAVRGVTEFNIREAGYVTEEKARYAQEIKEDQLRNAQIRQRNTDIANRDQAYRRRAQITYMENRGKAIQGGAKNLMNAYYGENLYNAAVDKKRIADKITYLKEQLQVMQQNYANMPLEDKRRTSLAKDIVGLQRRIESLIQQGDSSSGQIREGLLLGHVPYQAGTNLVGKPASK